MLVSTISRGNKYVRHIKVVSFEKNERKNKLKKAAACTLLGFHIFQSKQDTVAKVAKGNTAL